ncbi:MAG: Ig-like domain-containing protein, partial [Cyanobacteria bacterium CAN_BIN43]|nr:Ig-like domain-containing protein [Cyanobacteria bacterium CAN_BIN43]
TTPTFTGIGGTAGETITLYADGVAVGTGTVEAGGTWSVTTSALTEGDRVITVKYTDLAGNIGSASAQLPIKVDLTPPNAPTVPDLIAGSDDGTSPTDNITGDNTPTITGTAEPNSTVELFNGAASLGTTTTDGSGSWTFTPSSPLLVGTYSVTAKATDAAGNTGAASTTPLLLTITAPPGTPFNLDLVDASDTGASNIDEITQDSTPTLTGKADPLAKVVVFNGATNLGEVTANASGDWTFTPTTPLADGVYPFTARQKDGAGNLGTAATPLNITIDSAAPAAPATAPNLIDGSDTGTSNTDNVTSDNTPTFDGVAPLGAATVELFSGTTSLGKAPVDGSGNWSFTPTTALADNTYSITVKAIDAAGNISPASPALSVTIDALPPKVTFTPLQTNDTRPALTGKIDDPNAIVEVKINGVTYPATNKGDGTWFIPKNTIAPLPEGGFDILVTAKDKQGNSSTDNGGAGGAGGTTKAVTIDKTAPTGAILTVTPTPNGVNAVAIQFTEPVTNFDVSDLQLTRSEGGVEAPVSLAGAKLTSADGGKTWALTNIAGITKLTGDYKLTLNRSDIKDLAGNGIAAGSISSFRLGEDCVFGTALAVPTLKGKKGTKKTGSGGGNSLSGGKGKDEFKGMNGNDRLAGGGGSDRLDGGQGKDKLVGGTGRDMLMGGAGKDKIKGGGGKDMITGGGGKDLLVGGNGPDILIGGAKKDTLKGGRGKDMFVFNGLASEGNDLIKRFETNRDVIDLRSVFARAEFTGATPDAKFHKYIQTVQLGANTEVRVDFDGAGAGTVFGAIATLKNINVSTVSCSNFVVA